MSNCGVCSNSILGFAKAQPALPIANLELVSCQGLSLRETLRAGLAAHAVLDICATCCASTALSFVEL